jgi:hypothetical protein
MNSRMENNKDKHGTNKTGRMENKNYRTGAMAIQMYA